MGTTNLQFLKDFFSICNRSLADSDSLEQLKKKLDIAGFSAPVRDKRINPPLAADIHLHSNYSDGELYPRQVAWLAKLIGLQAAALVDHNSVSGVREFITEGQKIALEVWAGAELETAIPGCEILVYFPQTAEFLKFIDGPSAEPFLSVLARRQENLHSIAIKALPEMNQILKELGKTDYMTEQELAGWYSGVKPYYPGTLSVLFLERLSLDEREKLQLYSPRNVTTRYLTPILRRLKNNAIDKTQETLSLIRFLKRQGFFTLAVLAHPVELLRTAGMNLKEIRDFTMDLALNHGLDGIEVRNPRDGVDEIEEWAEIWRSVKEKLSLSGQAREFLAFSFCSDFHILVPDEHAGTFTLGYGLLNEDYPEGNLKSIYEWKSFRKMIFDLYRTNRPVPPI